jgi:hypothetical protein
MAFWKSGHAAPVQSHKFMVTWGGLSEHQVKSVTKPSFTVNEGMYQVGNHKFKYPGVHTWNDITIVFVDDKNTTRALIQKFMNQGWINPTNNDDLLGIADPERQTAALNRLYEDIAQNSLAVAPWGPETLPAQTPIGRLHSPISPNLTDDTQKKRVIGEIKIKQMTTVSKMDLLEAAQAQSLWLPAQEAVYGVTAKDIILEQWTLANSWIKSINFGQLDYSSDELITIEVVIAYDFAKISFPDDAGVLAGGLQ